MKQILMIFSLVASASGAIYLLEDRYALASELKETRQFTITSLKEFRIQQILSELNDLAIKEQFVGLTPYDKVRKEKLEKELEVLNK